MKLKLIILLILALIYFSDTQGQIHIGIERNMDYHEDENGYNIHSSNLFSMVVTNEWGLGIGGYWESKRVPFIHGDPGDKRSSGFIAAIPVTRVFMNSKFNAQITNKVKVFGNDIGKTGIWRYWVPSLQLDYFPIKNVGLMTKLTREFNCSSASIGIQFRFNND